MTLKSTNPANEKRVASFKVHDAVEINKRLEFNQQAYFSWKLSSFSERSQLILKVADLLLKEKEQLAFLATSEMGKSIVEARAEVEKCAWVCRYYAEKGEPFLRNEVLDIEEKEAFISFKPIGPVLAIMPWNFPYWQVFRFVAPNLMAGNTCVLKHASNVSGCALAMEELIKKAGFPSHVFTTLLIPGKNVEPVIADPRIKAVTLTGSNPAGKSVAAVAGKNLKKCVLELGGSDPYLILQDADMELAVEKCVAGRILNAGQSCIGAKRFIVVKEVAEAFTTKFTQAMQAIPYGDPLNEVNKMGPLARKDLREELHNQVLESIKKGAELLTGGYIPKGMGAFYPPTVLSNVVTGMPAYNEELFGPVASIIIAKNEKDAIRIANDTSFGLGAAVFTQDVEHGKHIAEFELEAGCVFVNDFVKSDPRVPFGGTKKSGFGRELSQFGIREFVNIKSVVASLYSKKA